MKIDVDQILKGFDGEALTDKDKPVALKTACMNALLGQYADEGNLEGAVKMTRYKLAERIHAGGTVELSAAEVASIQKLLAKAYAPLAYGAACELLDPPGKDDVPSA